MTAASKNGNNDLFDITRAEQYRTVDELFQKSRPGPVYYMFLVLSVFVIAGGLLLNNSPIVIGGMLITPLLTPVLLIALSIAVGELGAIKGVSLLLLKSMFLVVGGALFMTFVFGSPLEPFVIENTMRTAILYFIVAIVAGVAATFAWTRKEAAEVLPGIAIAVSLVPPLALIGIWLSALKFELVRFYFLVFFLNLVGVVVGSLVVFSLLKFYKSEARVQKKVEEAREIKE